MEKYPTLNQVLAAARRSKITLYVDENVICLVPSLRSRGFKVRMVKHQGLLDPEIQHDIEGEIIVTKNIRDFQYDALRFDYDIIDLSQVRFVDPSPEPNNQTALWISKAVVDHKIASLKGNFIVHIQTDGTASVETLA